MIDFFDQIQKIRIPDVFSPDQWQKKWDFNKDTDNYGRYYQDLAFVSMAHNKKAINTIMKRGLKNSESFSNSAIAMSNSEPGAKLIEYSIDALQRYFLFLDALNKRSRFFVEHEQGGGETVLSWKHETIIDGKTLARPVNYNLVQIIPPEGVTVREDGRPYIIIDPRAGHGSGIGGFKDASQVGAAIHQGHPTYFVTFTRMPVRGQTIADITAAEIYFVREVKKRHPKSPKPVIMGNCQGGWASMILAASSADITGPVVINGAPLSYWGGEKGKNPLRYLGGLVGGVSSVKLISDLGNGVFDGANLVLNFERLNPGENWWNKYYNLWKKIDTEFDRFVEFERWWGTFYFMNAEEITWIVENLFVGNRPGRGYANLNESMHIDLRKINSPIIVFASHGDNITPPQQALGWIRDNYRDANEIRARGQRILYTLHKDAGHLGIFVSSSVAEKEHTQIVSTLKTIEALQPGLYELVITEVQGEGANKEFRVSFANRTIDEMMAQAGGDDSNKSFAAVARYSELGSELYDLHLKPFVKAINTSETAKTMSNLHPLRIPRWLESDLNPAMWPVKFMAETVRNDRYPAPEDNPFRMFEEFTSGLIHQWWDGVRDVQDALIEWNFHLLWGLPQVQVFGEKMSHTISEAPQEDLRTLASVQDALDLMRVGGFAEGVVRMLIFLAYSRKEVRRSRLEKSHHMMTTMDPFKDMPPKQLTRLIHKESLIVGFEPEEAMATLPILITTAAEAELALTLCEHIAGPRNEMTEETVEMFKKLSMVLESVKE